MSRSSDLSPRMMMKVDLIGRKEAEFELIMIDTRQLLTESDNYYYFCKKNNFMVHFSTVFDFEINKHNQMINIPRKFVRGDNHISRIKFKNNDERYVFIRGIKDLLMEWTNSCDWENGNEMNKISYNSIVWILF